MQSSEIRTRFLKFFEERGHTVVPSSSLLPDDPDPSVLFTTAGMQPMMPYFFDEQHPLGSRITNSQKCFRSQDVEEVGDTRHTTFFEMLGNWSFGDYFKEEQLTWIFEFLIKELGLDPRRLYVTVFGGNDQIPRDTDASDLWKKRFKSVGVEAKDLADAKTKGMRDGRIFYYGDESWWSLSGAPSKMTPGEPGGTDSEMFYEFSGVQHDSRYGEYCHVHCDCGRYIEIGNNVFMEYQKQSDGSFSRLPKKNIDFGGGLERLTMASQDKPDVFQTDIFEPIVNSIKRLIPASDPSLNITYEGDPNVRRWIRIIADHIKAATMLLADGIAPSNKLQGYVVRRLIRRVIRFGRVLFNFNNKPFLTDISKAVIGMYKEQYPYLETKADFIFSQLTQEEARFNKTLNSGLKEVARYDVLDAKIAFRLYESFGFPFELTEEIAREKGQKVEYGEFKKEFEKHQEISRAGMEQKFGGHGLLFDTGELKAANEEELKVVTRLHTATHMLQQALREVLGPEVHQAGSDITVERTRFDFTFPRKLTPEEIKKVEDLVNEKVREDLPMQKVVLPKSEAEKTGALYFFKEKYPDPVNVYFMGRDIATAWSKEFCGGPHVTHSGEIGHFRIAKEEACSAGVRRIRGIVE